MNVSSGGEPVSPLLAGPASGNPPRCTRRRPLFASKTPYKLAHLKPCQGGIRDFRTVTVYVSYAYFCQAL